jgi:hypothetical protein
MFTADNAELESNLHYPSFLDNPVAVLLACYPQRGYFNEHVALLDGVILPMQLM